MKLTMPTDSKDPRTRRVVVDGHQVGLADRDFGGWIVGLWPIANRRPAAPFGGETLHRPRLEDLRAALCRRMDEHGPWWTSDAPTEETETDER
jgi:hypothetical protein